MTQRSRCQSGTHYPVTYIVMFPCHRAVSAYNRRVKAEGLSPVLTDLPPVIVLCAGMWTDKIQRVGAETAHLHPAVYNSPTHGVLYDTKELVWFEEVATIDFKTHLGVFWPLTSFTGRQVKINHTTTTQWWSVTAYVWGEGSLKFAGYWVATWVHTHDSPSSTLYFESLPTILMYISLVSHSS